jgi:hypothetical protein
MHGAAPDHSFLFRLVAGDSSSAFCATLFLGGSLMNVLKVGFFLLAVMAALLVDAAQANAVTVDANWWSNRTLSAGVLDPPGPNGPERIRLAQGHFTGFATGTVLLPSNQAWQIDAIITTDSQFNLPTEYVDIFINNNFEQRIFNTPLGTQYGFQHVFAGNQFSYRFEFSSPSNNEGSHLVVGRGTVTAIPEPAGIILGISGLFGLAMARRSRGARRT